MKREVNGDFPVVSFDSRKSWIQWLKNNHAHSKGVWLCLQKKRSNQKSLTYAEALDGALIYGWIDGQKKSKDEHSWLQKFTPRRSRSGWSKRNTENVARLIKSGEMKPPGLAEVEAAKKDGRWQAAYDSPSTATIPNDFLRELRKNKAAQAFFKTLNKANLYSIAYRLQTAKRPETREKRMRMILEMMKNGKKFG